MMIVPRVLILCGGLANVILQIRFSQYVERTLGVSVTLNCNLVSPDVVKNAQRVLGNSFRGKFSRVGGMYLKQNVFLGLLRRLKFWPFFVERENDKFLHHADINGFIFFIGYFQSYLYQDALNIDEFEIESNISLLNRERINRLADGDVVMHLRLGDYKNKKTEFYHGILPIEYYQDALFNYPSCKRVIVITNNADDAKKILPATGSFCVEIWSSEDFTDLDDFCFFCCASNIVISNSSFSYCAALYASKKRNARVTAPKNWFKIREVSEEFRFPADWKIL